MSVIYEYLISYFNLKNILLYTSHTDTCLSECLDAVNVMDGEIFSWMLHCVAMGPCQGKTFLGTCIRKKWIFKVWRISNIPRNRIAPADGSPLGRAGPSPTGEHVTMRARRGCHLLWERHIRRCRKDPYMTCAFFQRRTITYRIVSHRPWPWEFHHFEEMPRHSLGIPTRTCQATYHSWIDQKNEGNIHIETVVLSSSTSMCRGPMTLYGVETEMNGQHMLGKREVATRPDAVPRSCWGLTQEGKCYTVALSDSIAVM